jgi:hypothetical protein
MIEGILIIFSLLLMGLNVYAANIARMDGNLIEVVMCATTAIGCEMVALMLALYVEIKKMNKTPEVI